MDINWLIQRLRHGETYTAQTEDGDSYTVTRPPTSLSIKAAEVIIQQNNQLQSAAETSRNLMRQLQELNDKYEQIYKVSSATEISAQT